MGILDNEIAFVTGATRGIGKAVALALGKEGATVIGTATSENGSDSISKYLKDNGINGYGTVLDVTNSDAIDTVLKEMAEKAGGTPSVLVNNAGITRDNLLMRMKDDEWDAIMETNLKPIYRLSKAVIRPMTKARKGRIISISSVVGAVGNAGQSNYAAAKAGVVGFTKSLAREVAARNITVNAVAPGFIDTDMTRALTDEQKAAFIAQIPLGRLGSPEDVAEAVLFLASDRGAYITGNTIHVNGGMYMN
jgi:3-oxoacyl-[acyl-carrier protein] reductase